MKPNSGKEMTPSTDRSGRYGDKSPDSTNRAKTSSRKVHDFVDQQAALLQRFEEAKFARVSQGDGVAKASHDVASKTETHAEHDFNDPELVREQHRIYEEIQRRASARPARKPSPESRRTVQEEKLRAASRDQMVDLGEGKKIKIKGTRHVYKSIEKGTARLVNCPACRATLQVDRSTKSLYCVYCGQISPIDLADSAAVSNSTHSDEHIAQSVQQQEIDAKSSRKMSRSPGASSRDT